MLHDRVVCGINDSSIQRRLLAEVSLTLDKAHKLTQGMETAAQNMKELQGGTTSAPARDKEASQYKGRQAKVTPQCRGKSDRTCFRCGKPGHVASKCKFKDAQCYRCGKPGHVQAMCYGKARGTAAKRSGPPRPVQLVQEQKETEEYSLFRLGPAGKGSPYKVMLEVGKQSVTMEIDTGAALSLKLEATFKELWPERSPDHSSVHCAPAREKRFQW